VRVLCVRLFSKVRDRRWLAACLVFGVWAGRESGSVRSFVCSRRLDHLDPALDCFAKALAVRMQMNASILWRCSFGSFA